MDKAQPKSTATGKLTPVVGPSGRPASPVKPHVSNATPAALRGKPFVKRDLDTTLAPKPTFPSSPLVSKKEGASKKFGPPGVRPSPLGASTTNPPRPASPTKPPASTNTTRPVSPKKNARQNPSPSLPLAGTPPAPPLVPAPLSSSPALNLILSALTSDDNVTHSVKRVLLRRQNELAPALNILDGARAYAETHLCESSNSTAEGKPEHFAPANDHMIKLLTDIHSSHQTAQAHSVKLENAVVSLATAFSELQKSRETRDKKVDGRLGELLSGQEKILSFLTTIEPKGEKGKEIEVETRDTENKDVEMQPLDVTDGIPPSGVIASRHLNSTSPFIDLKSHRVLHARRRSTPSRTMAKPRPSLIHTKEERASLHSNSPTPLPTPTSAKNREDSPPLPRPPRRYKEAAPSAPDLDESDADEDKQHTGWPPSHKALKPRPLLRFSKGREFDDEAAVPSSDVEAELEMDEQPQQQETRTGTIEPIGGEEDSLQRVPSYADWTQAQKPESYGMDDVEEPSVQLPEVEPIFEGDEDNGEAQPGGYDAAEEATTSQDNALHREDTPTPSRADAPLSDTGDTGSSTTAVPPQINEEEERRTSGPPSSMKSRSRSPRSSITPKPKTTPTWSPVRPSVEKVIYTRGSSVLPAHAGVDLVEDPINNFDMDVDGEQPEQGQGDESDEGEEQTAEEQNDEEILEYWDDPNPNPTPASDFLVPQVMSFPQIEHKVEEDDDIPDSSDRGQEEEEDELLDEQQDERPIDGGAPYLPQEEVSYYQYPDLRIQPEFDGVPQDEDMHPPDGDTTALVEGAQEPELPQEEDDNGPQEDVEDPVTPEIPVQGLESVPEEWPEEHLPGDQDEPPQHQGDFDQFLNFNAAGQEDEDQDEHGHQAADAAQPTTVREVSPELGDPIQPITQPIPTVVAKPSSQAQILSARAAKPPSAAQVRTIVAHEQASRPRPIPLPAPRSSRSISPIKSGDSPVISNTTPRALAAASPILSNRSHVSPSPSVASVAPSGPVWSERSPPPPLPPPSSTVSVLFSSMRSDVMTEKGKRVFARLSPSPPPQREMSPELGSRHSSPLSTPPSSPERRDQVKPASTAPTSMVKSTPGKVRHTSNESRLGTKDTEKGAALMGTGDEDEPIVISSSDDDGEDDVPVASRKVDKGKGKARAREEGRDVDGLGVKMEDVQGHMQQQQRREEEEVVEATPSPRTEEGAEGEEEMQVEAQDEDEGAMSDESDVIPIAKFRRRRIVGKAKSTASTVAGTPAPSLGTANGSASTKTVDDPVRRNLMKLQMQPRGGGEGGVGQVQPSAAATKVKKKRKLDLGGESPLEHIQKRVKMTRERDSDEEERFSKGRIVDRKKGPSGDGEGRKKRGRSRKNEKEKDVSEEHIWPEQLTNEEDEFSQKFIGCDLCLEWFHYGCVGILSESDSRLKKQAKFRCPPCEIRGTRARSNKGSTNSSKMPVCGRPHCDKNMEGSFFVSSLIGRRPDPTNMGSKPTYQWLVRWADYPVKESTWEPEAELDDPQPLIQAFWKAIEKEKGKINFETQDMLLLKEAKKANVNWANQ